MSRFHSRYMYTVLMMTMIPIVVYYLEINIPFKAIRSSKFLFDQGINDTSTHVVFNKTISMERQTNTAVVTNRLFPIGKDDNGTVREDFIPNANYSVEQALEQIPICHFEDRAGQRALLTVFHAWTQFAHQNKIQYWLAYGSAIGYVQRAGLLPHDSDIDILMLAQDTQYLVPFADANFSSLYELKVHPQWPMIRYKHRSYHPSKGIDFVAPNARFIDRRLHYHVDIWPIYDFHPDQPQNTTSPTNTLTEYSRSYTWISSPREWTFPLKPCTFSGLEVWCPAMPEKIVTQLYGAESVKRSNRACVHDTWIKL